MRLFIAFLVICCVGCSQSSRYQFSLKGNIEGVKYGTVFLMTPGDSSIVLYKTDLEGGKFELKGELDEPRQVILKVNRRQTYFFMDGTNMEIYCPYSALSDKHIKGSPANNLAAEYDKLAQEGYYKEFNQLINEYKGLQDAGDQKAADEKMTPPRPFAAFRHETNLSIQKNRAIIYYQHNNYLKSACCCRGKR